MSFYEQAVPTPLSDIDHYNWAPMSAYEEPTSARSPLHKPLQLGGGHIPVPKPEPDYGLDFLENLPPSWYSQQEASYNLNVHMAANFQAASAEPLQLQITEPPTPAAECQVTSTNFSPVPQSPYSTHSDISGGYDGGEAFETSITMDASTFAELGLGEMDSNAVKGLTEEQLVSLTARDLNRLCRDMPDDVIKQLKKRRRTLKNRGYAYNSRVRRVSQKNGLEVERDDLKKQLADLTEKCKVLEQEAAMWKQRAQALETGNVN